MPHFCLKKKGVADWLSGRMAASIIIINPFFFLKFFFPFAFEIKKTDLSPVSNNKKGAEIQRWWGYWST